MREQAVKKETAKRLVALLGATPRLTYPQIAEELRLDVPTVSTTGRVLAALGMVPARTTYTSKSSGPPVRVPTAEQVTKWQKINQLRRENMTWRQVGEIVGVDQNSARHYHRKWSFLAGRWN